MNEKTYVPALKQRVAVVNWHIKLLPAGLQERAERKQRVSLGIVYGGGKKKRVKTRTEESSRPDSVEDTSHLVERYEDAKVVTFPKASDGTIILGDIYGNHGAIHRGMVKYWLALRKAKYIMEMLDVIKIEPLSDSPEHLKPNNEFGDNPTALPIKLLVPRKGGTRQWEYFDYIQDRKVPVKVRFPLSLPISKEEFEDLIQGVSFIDLQPLRRGLIALESIEPVENWFKGTDTETDSLASV